MTIKNGQPTEASDVIKSIGVTAGQLAYFGITTDSTNWTNENYLGADIFTDSNGVKNTIDTANTTAIYSPNLYFLPFTDEASGDTTHNPDGFSNPENAFDGDDGTYANKSSNQGNLGKTFSSSRTIVGCRVKAESESVGGASAAHIRIQTYDGSTWTNATGDLGISVDRYIPINKTCKGIRVSFFNGNNLPPLRVYTLEYGDADTSAVVETNTILNDVTPKSIVVYGKAEIPTDTDITIDVSDDGGLNWDITNQSVNYISDSNSFYSVIDTTTLSGSDLALKFNLSTTDTSKTPKFYGYSVVITDS